MLAVAEKQRCAGKVTGLAEVEQVTIVVSELLSLRVLNRNPVVSVIKRAKLTHIC